MRIDRYITRQIVIAMTFVVVSLTCVIWLTQSLRFIELIVNRGLPIETFIYLTVLLMPSWLSIVLPIACFAASLFVYNRLINDRELIVLAAAGMSPRGLVYPALKVSVATAALCYLMGTYLMPLGYREFKELQFSIRHNYSQVLLREGVFTGIGDKVTVFVREREASGALAGIMVHDARNPKEEITLLAERGALVASPTGPRVVMEKGNRQSRNTETGQYTLLYFDRYTVDIGGAQSGAKRTSRDQNELFVPELLNPTAEMTDPKNFAKFIAEGHHRLTSPLLAITLTIIGLAVLVRGEFSRRGQTQRIIIAVVIAGAAETIGLGSKLLVAKDLTLIPVMYLAVLLPGVIALAYLFTNRLGRRREPLMSAPEAGE